MSCPFLKEARVKYCAKSAIRKMIPIAGNVAQEICSLPRYRECSVYRGGALDSREPQCPHLRESTAEYCAAAAVSRLIPATQPLLSRCGSDAHRYCDVFLGAANRTGAETIGGILMPSWLCYSANHMWLDAAESGCCYLGLDAFLIRVLGTVERITFLRQTAVHRPCAVLTVRGVDLELIFPHPLLLTGTNLYLRANAAKLTSDPYGRGWLFQGVQPPGCTPVDSGLIRGDAIPLWIEREIGRMSAFLSECGISRHGGTVMNDGGVFGPDVLAHLSREETLRLFHEFFWGLREIEDGQ